MGKSILYFSLFIGFVATLIGLTSRIFPPSAQISTREKFGVMPTAKISTRQNMRKRQLSRYSLLHDTVYPTCCWHLLFVLRFFFPLPCETMTLCRVWLLFFLWIVSVRCISFFVCWLGCSKWFFKKRPEDKFMLGYDIVSFEYFDISIYQQVISHSSGQLNDDFTCYLQTTTCYLQTTVE